jgi:ABC-type Fe3+/spermidine/putrescine transport system ATPase subunit
VHLSVRPEKLSVSRDRPEENGHRNALPGIVEDKIYLGSQTQYRVRVGQRLILILQQHGHYLLDTKPITWNEAVWVSWHADDSHMIVEGDG